jgi:uncharacterized protein (TIGR00255 family)
MLKSMTAYGRASFRSQKGQFVAEIQSVNRKFLELNIFLPKELMRFDPDLRKWLSPHFSRGQITLKISVYFEESVPLTVQPNLALAKQVKEAWIILAEKLQVGVDQVNLSLLAKTEGMLLFEENFQEEEVYREAIEHVVELALKGFLHMKSQEGAVLQTDILDRFVKMRSRIKLIEQKAPDAPKKYREKLMARLEEVLPGKIENDERLLREVAVFAEKIDITEEIIRFYSHLNHFEELIQADNSQIGKTLEFVLQELNREINTIGSKSSDLEIARCVIDIKSELERIREQIQNVE